jgi:hypothetical protein
MKTDLLKEFFERDLTDAEEEQLSKQLSESTQNSMKFAKHAKSFYLKTGLPNPASHVGHLGHLGHLGHVVGSSMTLKVIGGLIAGGAIVATLHVVTKPAVQTIPAPVPTVISAPTIMPAKVATPTTPKPTPPKAQATSFKAPSTPNMVKPIAYDPRIKYEGLDLIVERQTAGLVTIRVLDSAKKEVRLLFAGLLNKGKWTFQWDGRLSNDDYAQPGTYQIQVQSGKEVLAKEITLQSEATASKK